MIGVGTPGWNCNPPVVENFVAFNLREKSTCFKCYFYEFFCEEVGAPKCDIKEGGKMVRKSGWNWRKRESNS